MIHRHRRLDQPIVSKHEVSLSRNPRPAAMPWIRRVSVPSRDFRTRSRSTPHIRDTRPGAHDRMVVERASRPPRYAGNGGPAPASDAGGPRRPNGYFNADTDRPGTIGTAITPSGRSTTTTNPWDRFIQEQIVCTNCPGWELRTTHSSGNQYRTARGGPASVMDRWFRERWKPDRSPRGPTHA